MNHSTQFADQVWQRTAPSLAEHRQRRNIVRSSFAIMVLLAGIVTLWFSDAPAEYQWRWSYDEESVSPSEFIPSIAVLVIDESGARFQELHAQEITEEGLNFDFTLSPVITDSCSYCF